MLNEGSGTSPSGAKPPSRLRAWLGDRANAQLVEVVVRVIALAGLWLLVTVAAVVWSHAGG